MQIQTVSVGYKPALLQGNSNQQAFQLFQTFPCQNPLSDDMAKRMTNDIGLIDGTHKAGFLGEFAQNRIKALPFADQPGCQFSMRVWTWREATWPGQSGQMLPVWIPDFLAELACVSGTSQGVSNPGPPASTNPYALPDTAYLCDTISLVQGALGLTGLVNSTGPGTGLPASVLMEIAGARFVTFDFQQTDQVGMNAMWAFC